MFVRGMDELSRARCCSPVSDRHLPRHAEQIRVRPLDGDLIFPRRPQERLQHVRLVLWQ